MSNKTPLDPLRNPKDPLRKQLSPATQELFKQYSTLGHGFAVEDIILASANLLVNALRQGYSRREKVEARFDEIFGQLKQNLVDHYDGAGNRRNVFPHTQHISVPLINLKTDFKF